MIHRIALAGPICSGKTTAADFIMDAYDEHSLLGFATPLYELASYHGHQEEGIQVASWIARNLSGLPEIGETECAKFFVRAGQAFHETPVVAGKNRTLLQKLGTEVGRSVDPELWAKLFRRNVEQVEDEYGPGIINDNLRFENEYDCLRDLGFLIVYLDVTPEAQQERYLKMYGRYPTEAELSHASERDLPFIRARADFVMDNSDDDSTYLRKCLRQLVEGETQPRKGMSRRN